MTETLLVIVIFFLLVHNMVIQRQFLSHLKELEQKLANIEPQGKVAQPNDIKENVYRDISDVTPNEIIK